MRFIRTARTATLALISTLALAGAASAAEYRLDAERSKIMFSYVEDGTTQEGRFSALTGSAVFDPAQPQAADVELTIRSDSIRLRDPVRTHFAQSIDWFHAEEHPDFTFRLVGLERIDTDRFLARGQIEIKGRVVDLAVELDIQEAEGGLRARGVLNLDRQDYGLGIGFSSLFSRVGEQVQVAFDLYGAPKG
ncbi:MAG: YceI family protein [Pseudomonadota bacterium]